MFAAEIQNILIELMKNRYIRDFLIGKMYDDIVYLLHSTLQNPVHLCVTTHKSAFTLTSGRLIKTIVKPLARSPAKDSTIEIITFVYKTFLGVIIKAIFGEWLEYFLLRMYVMVCYSCRETVPKN